MTDPTTDAVRRLKELQEDVERLKAGDDEQGDARIFISEGERAIAIDVVDLKPSDIDVIETAIASDEQSLVDNDIEAVDVATAADEQSIRLQREQEPLHWGSAGWGTSHWTD